MEVGGGEWRQKEMRKKMKGGEGEEEGKREMCYMEEEKVKMREDFFKNG